MKGHLQHDVLRIRRGEASSFQANVDILGRDDSFDPADCSHMAVSSQQKPSGDVENAVESPATVRVGASQETRSHGEAGHGEERGVTDFMKLFITRLPLVTPRILETSRSGAIRAV